MELKGALNKVDVTFEEIQTMFNEKNISNRCNRLYWLLSGQEAAGAR